jgi:hypothetical protein
VISASQTSGFVNHSIRVSPVERDNVAGTVGPFPPKKKTFTFGGQARQIKVLLA